MHTLVYQEKNCTDLSNIFYHITVVCMFACIFDHNNMYTVIAHGGGIQIGHLRIRSPFVLHTGPPRPQDKYWSDNNITETGLNLKISKFEVKMKCPKQ